MPLARVGDFDDDSVVIDYLGRQRNRSAAEHRVARVDNQIGENLLQFSGVAENFRRRFGVIFDDFDVRFSQLRFKQLKRVVEKFVNVDFGKFSRRCRRGKNSEDCRRYLMARSVCF